MKLNVAEEDLKAVKVLLEEGKNTHLRVRDPDYTITKVADKYLEKINKEIDKQEQKKEE